MQCTVDGCCKPVRYKSSGLCQMHYFRVMRGGTTELRRGPAKPRIEDERGYQFLHAPGHPLLAKGQMYVAEHRILMYAVLGPGPMNCALCGCALTWKTCQIDHVDENPRNNALSNLRPLCRRCNVWRNMPPAYLRKPNAMAITFEGETKTPYEWSKDPRVSVSATAIRQRKAAGMTDAQALFASKVTHNGNRPKPYVPKTFHKHERSNAVAVTVDGVTRTAAEWTRQEGVSVTAPGLICRIRAGWDAKRAVYEPPRAQAIRDEYRAMNRNMKEST